MLNFQNKSTAGSYADGIVIKGCAFLSQGIPSNCILKMLLDNIYIYICYYFSFSNSDPSNTFQEVSVFFSTLLIGIMKHWYINLSSAQ